MSGSTSALVGLARLMAYADDLTMVFANMWMDLLLVVEFVRWAVASGLTLSVAKCVIVLL